MSLIHKSHSRKSLQEIVEIFELDIPDYLCMDKADLSKELWRVINQLDGIQKDDQYTFVHDICDLQEYLKKQDQRKCLTVKEKDRVVYLAKELIYYSKNNYSLVSINCMDHDELYRKAQWISKFGDIPMVRRAIRMFNMDTKLDRRKRLLPIISKRVKYKMDQEKQFKSINNIGMLVQQGSFSLSFD